MKTEQETFDLVYLGLAAQGWRQSITDNGECRYRMTRIAYEGDITLKCAAGHIIPDELYQPDFEGKSVKLTSVGAIIATQGHSIEFVNRLQILHDGSSDPGTLDFKKFTFFDPSEMQRRFERFAAYRGLTIPKVPA